MIFWFLLQTFNKALLIIGNFNLFLSLLTLKKRHFKNVITKFFRLFCFYLAGIFRMLHLCNIFFRESKSVETDLCKSVLLKYFVIVALLMSIAFPSNVWAVEFYSVNSLFGISHRVTNSICKDDNGFIWASSKTGILRITDDDCRIYQLPYETEGVLMVRMIYENSKLTAYTNNGQVFVYNTVYDRFDLLFNLNNMLIDKNYYVFTILTDNNNDFWIALSSGLYKYHSGILDLIDSTLTEGYSITWLNLKYKVWGIR